MRLFTDRLHFKFIIDCIPNFFYQIALHQSLKKRKRTRLTTFPREMPRRMLKRIPRLLLMGRSQVLAAAAALTRVMLASPQKLFLLSG